MAHIADDDEGRRGMIGIEQENVGFSLLARILHHHVPAARNAAAAEIRGLFDELMELPWNGFLLARQTGLLGFQDEGVLLVEIFFL
jgi:hypothetical protein